MRVRAATVDDVAEIVRLQQSCGEAPQWTAAQYEAMLGAQDGWPKRALLVAEEDGIAGYAVAAVVLEEAELESVAVERDRRRQGIGRGLCEALMQWARERGAREMRLEVRAGNGAAQQMYGALGWVESGRRAGYYSGPTEDALLMRVML